VDVKDLPAPLFNKAASRFCVCARWRVAKGGVKSMWMGHRNADLAYRELAVISDQIIAIMTWERSLRPTSLQGNADAIAQCRGVERFGEKTDRARCHGLDAHRLLWKCGHEDDGNQVA
jgi:hypothetical protein